MDEQASIDEQEWRDKVRSVDGSIRALRATSRQKKDENASLESERGSLRMPHLHRKRPQPSQPEGSS